MWGIFNEYDKNNVDPVNVAFVVQALIKLENDRGVLAADRLPITVPVSLATRTAAEFASFGQTQPPFFQAAEQLYERIKPSLTIPGGVLAQIALSTAFERTNQQNTISYGGVPVVAMPTDFWTSRFVAAVNPFESPLFTKNYITDPNQFQSAFPGNTPWNTLPPLWFSTFSCCPGRRAKGIGARSFLRRANLRYATPRQNRTTGWTRSPSNRSGTA